MYYLGLPNGNPFGYYSFLSARNYLYHFDLGYEYVFDAADGADGMYFYDFSLNTVLYYYPDPHNAGHYNIDSVRYFYGFVSGQIISK